MKITLDLTDLTAKGQLTQAEADRLKGLAARDTGTLGVNILLSFGMVALSLGIGVLVPTIFTAIALGALMFGVGLSLTLAKDERWAIFAQVCMVVGALAFTGGISAFANGDFWVNLAITAVLAGAAVAARSGLLAAVAIIGLGFTVGTSYTGWSSFTSATVITIAVLSVVAIGLYLISLRLPRYENVAIVGARTAVLMVNLGFLAGSLFGDAVLNIPSQVFAVAWAILLIVVGLWGVQVNRRWVVNAAAVFGGIHFFCQWFLYLGASPLSILGGGVLLILFGFGLKAVNDRRHPAVAAT